MPPWHKASRYRLRIFFLIACIGMGALFFFITEKITETLLARYRENESVAITDRYGIPIVLRQNGKRYYAAYAETIPDEFKRILLQKEDKYFYYHPGINPISALRAIARKLQGRPPTASTITLQTAKILLGNEKNRTMAHKLKETIAALALETQLKKEDILIMYANSIYFGNGIQGIREAARFYFDVAPEFLTREQTLRLIATISSPSLRHPMSSTNIAEAKKIAERLGIGLEETAWQSAGIRPHRELFFHDAAFELPSLGVDCVNNCNLTIDAALTKQIREILSKRIKNLESKNVKNGAVVIVKLPENEILSIVGAAELASEGETSQINMAIAPRPIGSTIKPLLYLKGFEKGLRPYSLVDDREYKYTIADGFAFYPKNFDYAYRGMVSLHTALANSLNVPSVKVLEYIGIDAFSKFLTDDLGFAPIQPIETYQLGIALGGLEMNLLQLVRYMSILPQEGILKPLVLSKNNASINHALWKNMGDRQDDLDDLKEKRVAPQAHAQLVSAILTDRLAGAEQFGLVSSLNLFQKNYAIKTGTSREFHDSWVIGYTPDFLVGVWLGNAENTPMDGVSGQLGAGTIWSEVMELLFHSPYNKKTPLGTNAIESIMVDGTLTYGLPGEQEEAHRDLLFKERLILSPHEGDVILLEDQTEIPLTAAEEADWFVDGMLIGQGKTILFAPAEAKRYEIRAVRGEREESVSVMVRSE